MNVKALSKKGLPNVCFFGAKGLKFKLPINLIDNYEIMWIYSILKIYILSVSDLSVFDNIK